jgi:hypothetical protein
LARIGRDESSEGLLVIGLDDDVTSASAAVTAAATDTSTSSYALSCLAPSAWSWEDRCRVVEVTTERVIAEQVIQLGCLKLNVGKCIDVVLANSLVELFSG